MANGRWRNDEERRRMQGEPPARRYTRNIPTPGSIAVEAAKKKSLGPTREAIRKDFRTESPGLMEAGGVAGRETSEKRGLAGRPPGPAQKELGNYFWKRRSSRDHIDKLAADRDRALGNYRGVTPQYTPVAPGEALWPEDERIPQPDAPININMDPNFAGRTPHTSAERAGGEQLRGRGPRVTPHTSADRGRMKPTDLVRERFGGAGQAETIDYTPRTGVATPGGGGGGAPSYGETWDRADEGEWKPRFTGGRMTLEQQQTALNSRYQAYHQAEHKMLMEARKDPEFIAARDRALEIRRDAEEAGHHDEQSILGFAIRNKEKYGFTKKPDFADIEMPTGMASTFLLKTGDKQGYAQDYIDAQDLVPMGIIRGTERSYAVGLTGKEYPTLQEALTGIPEDVSPREELMADVYKTEKVFAAEMAATAAYRERSFLERMTAKEKRTGSYGKWTITTVPDYLKPGQEAVIATATDQETGALQVMINPGKGGSYQDAHKFISGLWENEDYRAIHGLLEALGEGEEADAIAASLLRTAPSNTYKLALKKYQAKQARLRRPSLMRKEKEKEKEEEKTEEPKGKEYFQPY